MDAHPRCVSDALDNGVPPYLPFCVLPYTVEDAPFVSSEFFQMRSSKMHPSEDKCFSRNGCPMCSVTTAPAMPVVMTPSVGEDDQAIQSVPTVELLSSFAANMNDILASGYHLWQNLHTGEFQLCHQQQQCDGCVKPGLSQMQSSVNQVSSRKPSTRARPQRKCKRPGTCSCLFKSFSRWLLTWCWHQA